jgi:hypothetical protein
MIDRRSLRLLLPWFLAGVIPAVLLPAVAGVIAAISGASIPLGPVLFPLFIILFAGSQAVALRFHVSWSGSWFRYSAVGCLVAMLVTLPALALLDPVGWPEPVVLSITHGLGGLVVGTFQWLALRTRLRGTWVWIVLNGVLSATLIAGWYPLFDATWAPGGMPVGFEGDHELRQLLRITASAALVTGPVLLWLLRPDTDSPAGMMRVGGAA